MTIPSDKTATADETPQERVLPTNLYQHPTIERLKEKLRHDLEELENENLKKEE